MTVLYDADISGSGSAAVPVGHNTWYVALLHISAVGPEARPIGIDPDHYMRLGWWTTGGISNVIGGVDRTYWNPPMWLNTLDSRFAPSPNEVGSLFSLDFLGMVRWALTYGTLGHLYVEGP